MAFAAGDGSGGGSRPFSSRARSAGRFFNRQNEKQKAAIDEQKFNEEIQHLSEDLNVRVRERDPTAVERPRSRLGSLKFNKSGNESSSVMGGGPSASLEQKANELKGTLSNIFRRSQSTDRSSQQQQQQQLHGGMPQQSSSPQSMAPIPSSLPPASSYSTVPRGPLTSSRQQQQGIGRPPTAIAAKRGTNSGNQNQNNLIVANGSPQIGVGTTNSNITTTAIRPFSAFPGKKAAAQTTEQTSSGNQSTAAKFEMDLSEQASIAPHISMSRISVIATDPVALFFDRQQHQQSTSSSSNVQQMSRGSARKNGAAEEIDVNFLSRFLCPEDEIQDEQIPWTWDSLFASVTSELREEWALEEEANNNEGGGGAAEMGPPAAGGIIPNGMAQQQHQRQGYVQQRGF